jgi:cellulose synthase/poly-beta-1,6-N-acetylglucosamine synthase-like glycosyltransferase/transposase-like protein
MKRLPAQERLSLIKAVTKDGQRVTDVCKEAGISRFTFYKWFNRFKKSSARNQTAALSDRNPSGKLHWRSSGKGKEKEILDVVLSHPSWSVHDIFNDLQRRLPNLPISHHLIQNVLERYDLRQVTDRYNFATSHPTKTFETKKFTPQDRFRMIQSAAKSGNVSEVCDRLGISRFTYYKWLKRYQDSYSMSALESRRPNGENHWRAVPKKAEWAVLNLVKEYPALSVSQLADTIRRFYGANLVGHHGIQNILERYGLSRFESRLAYSQAQAPTVVTPVPVPTYGISLRLLRWVIAPFATIPKIAFNHPRISIPVFFFIFFVLLYDVEPSRRVGLILSTIALTFGTIFFLYSLKYYSSLALILSHSYRSSKKNAVSAEIDQGVAKDKPGLISDINKINLTRKPFVSIHIPLYNEKRVAERILTALAGIDYPNYEVIVVDDSTDETTDIINRFKYNLESDPNRNNPIVKVLHRGSREGFKGGALRLALQQSDPRTEFVIVFDADFVPYPDTIDLFLKYFKASNKNNEDYTYSKVAAVQGYQWHVLNKSENWITRGVRTEYSGSYVIERSGAEYYGGLKQIAGSVFCARADVLKKFGWGTSITEDFELTLRLYESGYKVLYTPYVQAPSECVSTLRRLIRQRMRWAEGHTHNVRKMFARVMASKYLSRPEKLEFTYLAPYYLQAAFFVIGTLSWLIAEIVIKANLPFWTSTFGWSLLFTNFFALPMMNLVGLLLEESEERDYFGVGSFVLLSYVLVPFQAYAALKGLFEKEEGHWFRTPKTGHVTDSFDRSKVGKLIRVFLPWGRKGAAAAQESPAPVFVSLKALSAFNPLSGGSFKPRRIPLVSKSAIAILLVIMISINYLAFFAEPKVVEAAGTPKIEQQINIITKEFSTSSASYQPTNSQVAWGGSTNFSNIDNVYFEAVIKSDNAAWSATAELYNVTDSTSVTTVSTNATSYTRMRSADISGSANLQAGDVYTVRYRVTNILGTAYIQAARIIVLQVGVTDESITKSQTQVEVGAYQTGITSTSYVTLDDPKYYCYATETDTGTTCSTDDESTVWSPTPTATFSATVKIADSSDSVSARLIDEDSNVRGEFTFPGSGSTTWVLVADLSVTLTAGQEYYVQVKCTGTDCSASIANAKIILDQDATASGGIDALETIQHYNTFEFSTDQASWVELEFMNEYKDDNFQVPTNAWAESVLKVDNAIATSYGAICKNLGSCSGTDVLGNSSTSSTTAVRVRGTSDIAGSLPTSTTDMDAVIWCDTSNLNCVDDVKLAYTDASTWLIIQLQSIPVPEIAIFALPLLIFLPKIVKWFKARKPNLRKLYIFGRS